MSTTFVPRIHAMPDSGNCYKPCLLLDLLGREYEWVSVDPFAGETRSPAFLAKNPLGRVPVLEYAPGAYLAESNAMLVYLAQGTPFWPDDPLAQARILAWLFFEQNNHEVWIASSRFLLMFTEARPDSPEIRFRREPGLRALGQMETHLTNEPWFGQENIGLADIALFAYTHVADEGGFELGPYPAVRGWLDRVRAQPGFRPMRRESTDEA